MTETSEKNCKTDYKSCKILFCYIFCQCMSEIVVCLVAFRDWSRKRLGESLITYHGFSTE